MAEESDLSRSEPASPRRLHEARLAGDVPRSAEWSAWFVLLVALGFLFWSAAGLLDSMQVLLASFLQHAARPLSPDLTDPILAVMWSALPVLAASFVAALAPPLVMSGWVFAPRAAQADLARARPFQVVSRMLSADFWVDGGLGLLKMVVVALAVAWAFAEGWPDLQRLSNGTISSALDSTLAWIGQGVLALVASLAFVAALDAGWRWWRYLRRHAMTWQEVLAEAREDEGSPELRARIRSRQQQAGRAALSNPVGKNATPGASPLASPPPEGERAKARPRTINEVIG